MQSRRISFCPSTHVRVRNRMKFVIKICCTNVRLALRSIPQNFSITFRIRADSYTQIVIFRCNSPDRTGDDTSGNFFHQEIYNLKFLWNGKPCMHAWSSLVPYETIKIDCYSEKRGVAEEFSRGNTRRGIIKSLLQYEKRENEEKKRKQVEKTNNDFSQNFHSTKFESIFLKNYEDFNCQIKRVAPSNIKITKTSVERKDEKKSDAIHGVRERRAAERTK